MSIIRIEAEKLRYMKNKCGKEKANAKSCDKRNQIKR